MLARYALALIALGLTGCDRHAPARADITACHGQIMNSAPHQDDDIIDVHEHRQMLICMAQKGYAFQSKNTECVTRMTQADNPACYARD